MNPVLVRSLGAVAFLVLACAAAAVGWRGWRTRADRPSVPPAWLALATQQALALFLLWLGIIMATTPTPSRWIAVAGAVTGCAWLAGLAAQRLAGYYAARHGQRARAMAGMPSQRPRWAPGVVAAITAVIGFCVAVVVFSAISLVWLLQVGHLPSAAPPTHPLYIILWALFGLVALATLWRWWLQQRRIDDDQARYQTEVAAVLSDDD